MTSLMRAAVVTVAALALVVASGCGSSDTKSANDYVKSINKIQTDFAASMNSTASTPSSSSDPMAGARATFTKIDKGLQKVVTELKGVTPPDKVKDLHQELVREIGSLDSEVKKVANSVSTTDLKQIAAAQTSFAKAAEKLQTQFSNTIGQINQKLQG